MGNRDEWVMFVDGTVVAFEYSLTAAVARARIESELGRRAEIENEWGYRAEVEEYVRLLEETTAMRFPKGY